MLTVWVAYYSQKGTTERLAKRITKELKKLAGSQASIKTIALRETKKRSAVNSFLVGAPQALFGKDVALEPLPALGTPDRLVILTPVWAGRATPAAQTFLRKTPQIAGARALGLMTSSSGAESSAVSFRELLTSVNCKPIRAEVVASKDVDSQSLGKWLEWLLNA